MSNVTNEMIMQAILELKGSVQQVETKVETLEAKVDRLDEKIESVRAELKQDIDGAVETIMAGFESVYDSTKTENEYIKMKINKHDEDIFSLKSRIG